MEYYLNSILVGPQQFVPLAVGVVLWLGLAGLSIIFTDRNRLTELNVLYGWAVVSTVFTLSGVIFRSPFLVVSIIFAVFSVVGIGIAIHQKQALFVPGSWRILVLAMPLFLISGAMEPSQWDEFSHWLPAPKYLLAFDGFPNAKEPFNGAPMLAAYPYGWPILSYLSAQIAGKFISNIGGVLNLLLLITLTTLTLRTALRLTNYKVKPVISWGFASSVILCATIFNPTFIQKIVLTAYSDISTAVTTGAVLLAGYYYLDALPEKKRTSPWSGAWQLSLLLMLLINLRQSNLVLFTLFSLAVGFLAWRDPDIRFKQFLIHLPIIVLPAIFTYFSWRYYVFIELGNINGSEATFRPLDRWNIYEIPLILKQMFLIAIKKIGFFGPMAIAVYLSIGSLLRFKSSFDQIVILCAIGFIGYNTFLLLTYVGVFSTFDALRAVSYWRYNTHIGMVGVIFIVSGTVVFWSHKKGEVKVDPKIRVIAITLVLLLPLLFSHKLRFDLEPPKPFYTFVAKSLIGTIPSQSKLFVVDPKGTGESAVIARYYLEKSGTKWLSVFHDPTPQVIDRYLSRVGKGDFLLVHSIIFGLQDSLNKNLEEDKSYLLKRQENGWKLLRSWEHPHNHHH